MVSRWRLIEGERAWLFAVALLAGLAGACSGESESGEQAPTNAGPSLQKQSPVTAPPEMQGAGTGPASTASSQAQPQAPAASVPQAPMEGPQETDPEDPAVADPPMAGSDPQAPMEGPQETDPEDPALPMAGSDPQAPMEGPQETDPEDSADPPVGADTWDNFAKGFFESYCVSCHPSALSTRDYNEYAAVMLDADTIRCGVALVMLEGCPPSPPPMQFPIGAGPHPTDEERERIVAWIEADMPQ